MNCTYVGIPFTRHIEVATMKSVYETAFIRGDERRLFLDPLSCSVLPQAFNFLWCRCINFEGAPDGDGFRYFCMLHSDVVPLTPGWLGILIDELESTGADVMHAPVAIKDQRGATSTSIGQVDDDWDLHRKLTVQELHEMPETFGVEHVMSDWRAAEAGWMGKRICLCPNTGLLLAKVKEWCWEWPGFEFKSKIVDSDDKRVGPHGKRLRQPNFVSEDWLFGHWCGRMGLRVMGTRKVKTTHVGSWPFTTDSPWGEQAVDENYFKAMDIEGESTCISTCDS